MTRFRPRASSLFNAAPALVGLLALSAPAFAQIGDVFVIDMENHNFSQPSSYTNTQALKNNSAAPYMNSLITAGNPNAAQTSWASSYYNAGYASGLHIHPSLPSYLWQEAGTNGGVASDNMPFGTGGVNQGNTPSLTALLQSSGISWKSYQEGIDLLPTSGTVNNPGANSLTNTVAPQSQWTVPLQNFSGTSASYTNPYNGSHQYNFATKHDGSLYYNATNGGNDMSASNPEIPHYAPLEQLTNDLNANTVARYNLITPDQFNDGHTSLTGGFTYNGIHYSGDAANIAQADNFLSILVPQIMASSAYQNNGMISIWWDETEGGDTTDFTLQNIVISPLAVGNAFNVTQPLTHSSDLKTYQEIFGVTGGGKAYLGDAANPATNDLSQAFVAGTLPQVAAVAGPEPSTVALLAVTGMGFVPVLRRKRGQRIA